MAESCQGSSTSVTQCRAKLKRGPFHVGDLVLTRRLQTPKGRSTFAGPFKVVKGLGRYSYLLSDGQKWNIRLLKQYIAPTATWTEFPGTVLPVVGGCADVGDETMGDAAEEDLPILEHPQVHAIFPVTHRYPDRERKPPERFSPEDYRRTVAPKKRGV